MNNSDEEDDDYTKLVIKEEQKSESEGEYTIEEVDVDHLKVEIKEENKDFGDEGYEKKDKKMLPKIEVNYLCVLGLMKKWMMRHGMIRILWMWILPIL